MVHAKVFCHLAILLLSFCFMVVKCSIEPSDQFVDNPTETKQDALAFHKRPSFFVGSRYGRSGSSSSGSSVFATSKTRRLNVVPRNDRFFLSSRYGKRAVVPMLSTPYEQALISEISTGTQLSSKPIPEQHQQFNNNVFDTNRMLPQQAPLSSSASSLSSSLPPYDYMRCVYTGLQNYYRCNSMLVKSGSMFYFKNSVINGNNHVGEAFSPDASGAVFLKANRDDDTDDDNVVNDNNDVDENDKK